MKGAFCAFFITFNSFYDIKMAINNFNVKVLMFIFFTFIISCAQKEIQYNQIIGSWKMRDVVNQTGEDISDKTTFKMDSTFIAETFLDGNVVEAFTGKYKINQNKKTISIQSQDYEGEFEFIIETLNSKELNLKDKKTGRITQNIRY